MRTLLAESFPPGCTESQAFRQPGSGFPGAGPNRLEAIANSGIAGIAAIADASPELAAQPARTFPSVAVLTSLNDLSEVGVDGIAIATPSALHAEVAVSALERGMATFCQKPSAPATLAHIASMNCSPFIQALNTQKKAPLPHEPTEYRLFRPESRLR